MNYFDRMRCKSLQDRIMSADEAATIIKSGMTVGTSGFTPTGYPKAVPEALVKKVQGDSDFKINLYTGASVGKALDGDLGGIGVINRRMPYQSNSNTRTKINNREIRYADIHLSHFAQEVRYGFYGKIDIAIIEATKVTEDGLVVLTTSVGASPVFCGVADTVIIEINTKKPMELEGIHDIYQLEDPPYRKPIPLLKPDDRLGSPYLKINLDKIKAIVFTDKEDDPINFAPVCEKSQGIAKHIVHFFEEEVAASRLPEKLLPLQSGVGSVANAVLKGISDSSFNDLVFYSEVIQDNVLDLVDDGTFRFASSTSLTLSQAGFKRFYDNLDYYKGKVILRPMEISNNPEIIRRIGSIAMNTAIEVDLFGNVNSTNIMGRNMMNGIGGSGDFTRSGYLSIFTTPSIAKNGDISSIVPMVSHVDHTEHDVKIIVTEQGLADLRGLSPYERAEKIIEKCAHPDYRPLLQDYLQEAKKHSGHTPHLMNRALEWHERYNQTKSMKI